MSVVDFFNQHIVGIYFTFEVNGESQPFLITSFVLSVDNQWYLITAGHCIHEVEKAIQHGYKLINCVLIDSLGFDFKHENPIVFPYLDMKPQCLSDGDEIPLDFGVIPLSPHYVQLLLANGIKALNEEVWEFQPDRVDGHLLLGISSEMVKVSANFIELSPTLHPVQELSVRPEEFPETDLPQFYGHVTLGDKMTSIKGMSGGPIFALKNENGQFRYWLTAVQSRWLPDSHIILGSPIYVLGNYLKLL